MPKFHVDLDKTTIYTASITVLADDEEQAAQRAEYMANTEDSRIEWELQGDTIETADCNEVPE